MDMAGAAAVAGAVIAIAKLKLNKRVLGVMPIVENMPSGSATRPGDVVKSYEGKTVEIGNTDAEGRLILIDALAYTIEKYKPDAIIDLATLTGACVIALGEKIAGVFSFDSDLAKSIVASGEKTYERCFSRVKAYADDTELEDREKLEKILWDVSTILHQTGKGENIIWPVRISLGIQKEKGKWKIRQCHFSYPTQGFPTVRFSEKNAQDYENMINRKQ